MTAVPVVSRQDAVLGVLITGVTVMDGTGAPGYLADVRLAGGRIELIAEPGTLRELGTLSAGDQDRVIDGRGLVLSPGFIDMHAHSDLQILIRPDHYAKISQGVTTEVLGQDGLSYAPVNEQSLAVIRQQIAGWNENPADFDFGWATVGEYLDRLDQGIATNAAYLIPQGTVRALVMGFENEVATPDQIAAQQSVVRQGMDQGAVGMSSGLTYTPGMYASDEELAALCEVVGEYGGFYAPHHRSYGEGALQAYEQMIELAQDTGCALHLTHATMNFAPNKGRAPELLEKIDTALAAGADISLDTYPYLAGATTLSAILPSWAAAGGVEQTLLRLSDPEIVVKIRHDVEVLGSDGCHGVIAQWETIEISGVQNLALAGYVGKTIAEIAAETGTEPYLVFVEILIKDRLATGILQHVGDESNVQAIMKHKAHMGGSDGILVGAKPHPRVWGTFPRFLGHYSRDLGLLPLEQMIHHLTGRPAARLGLVERGLIRAGWAADVVLFDPHTIADASTYQDPRQPAHGISYVFVNGSPAIWNSEATGALAGRALRKTTRGTTTV